MEVLLEYPSTAKSSTIWMEVSQKRDSKVYDLLLKKRSVRSYSTNLCAIMLLSLYVKIISSQLNMLYSYAIMLGPLGLAQI